jgi:acyl dehydratase
MVSPVSALQAGSVQGLAGHRVGTSIAAYGEREAILYALAVGARADEIGLVYERELRVLPTYGLALGLWAVESVGALGAYDPVQTLHVSQTLDVHRALPRRGEIEMESSVVAVWDKGSAALVEISVSSEFFDAVYGIWVPGAGGFGGERGPSARVAEETTDPELRLELETGSEQAALYRLTGDLHPLHVDPEVAVAAGFERPILHGLCVLGGCALSLARSAGEDPAAVGALAARFAAPVYPGETLAIAGWRDEEELGVIRFSAAAADSAVLSGGRIELERGRG